MRSAVIILVLCAFACFASASQLRSNSTMEAKVLTRNNFFASCSGVSFSGSTLYASCRTISGSSKNTALNLDNCFSNTNGYFSCGGAFSRSAQGARLQGQSLVAKLQTRSGSWLENGINLNSYISNINGDLKCDCYRDW